MSFSSKGALLVLLAGSALVAGCTSTTKSTTATTLSSSTTSPSSSSTSVPGDAVSTSLFSTVAPQGWTQTTGSPCDQSALLCLYTDEGSASGAAATVSVEKGSPFVSQSDLDSGLSASAQKNLGAQDLRVSSMTVGGESAAAADFDTPGGSYAAENWEVVWVDHQGVTYIITLGARRDLEESQSHSDQLFTDTYVPGFRQVLSAWHWV